MPLTKEQKAVFIDEIVEQLQDTTTFYLTDYQGLTVEEANELRQQFRDSGVEYKVIKNTLLRLAMERLGGYDELFDHLHGPTAVAFTAEPAAPARVMKKFVEGKEKQRPELKAAFVDGAFFGPDQLDALASLKSKDELIGDILGLLMAPITNVVGGLQAQGQNIVGALKTIAEKEN